MNIKVKKYHVLTIEEDNGRWTLSWEDLNGWHPIKSFDSYKSADNWQRKNIPGAVLMNNIPF